MVGTSYPYGREFQLKVLALTVQDPVFLASHMDVVAPAYFDDPTLSLVCGEVVEFTKKFNRVPTNLELKVHLESKLFPTGISADEISKILAMANHLFLIDTGPVDFIKEQMIKFASLQALKGVVINIAEKVGSGKTDPNDIDEMRKDIDRAMMVGSDRNLGFNFGEKFRDIRDIIACDPAYSPDSKIRTLWPSTDAMFTGIGPGEIGILVGSKNTGKSTILVNLGYTALLQGKKVLHICCELKQQDVAVMYVSRMTGIQRQSILGIGREELAKIEAMGLRKDSLTLKYFSPATLTPTGLRSYLNRLRFDGIEPDLIVLDYLKQMKCGRDHNGYGELVDALIGILDDYKTRMWTAHQGNRTTYNAENVSMSQIGDSWQIIEKADIIGTIQQSLEDKLSNKDTDVKRLALRWEGVRRGRSSSEDIPMLIDYSRCSVLEDEVMVESLKNINNGGFINSLDGLKVGISAA